ncbi:MAG: hypothetical protein AAF821_21820 [Cyanobacteria bacterium P01_D01_bin.156]
MKFLAGLCLVSSLVISPSIAHAEEQLSLLLNLQYKTDTNTTREVQFYGNDINPNSISVDDRFSLTIGGEPIEVPEQIYRRLDRLRRSFSYDSLSGGIQQPTDGGIRCTLGGPAQGMILETRYLTFKTPEYRIVSHEMRPVFGMAQNCLFTERYQPADAHAQSDARAVVEILNTLNLLMTP